MHLSEVPLVLFQVLYERYHIGDTFTHAVDGIPHTAVHLDRYRARCRGVISLGQEGESHIFCFWSPPEQLMNPNLYPLIRIWVGMKPKEVVERDEVSLEYQEEMCICLGNGGIIAERDSLSFIPKVLALAHRYSARTKPRLRTLSRMIAR